MSNGGNGGRDDDDIDRLIDALNDTNANIDELTKKVDRLVEGMTRAAREEAGGEPEGQVQDLWDVGKMSSGTAETPEAYARMRAQTAKSEDLGVPRISRSREVVPFLVEVYRMYAEHLQRIYFALNNDQWEEFIRRLAVLYGAEEELVDILNPSPSTFGVITTDKEVDVIAPKSHMNFTDAYGNYWFGADVDVSGKSYSGPSEALGLPEDTNAETIFGRLSDHDINKKLASAIDDRSNLSLPDNYRHLL